MIWSVQVTVWLTAREGLQVCWLSGVTNIQRNNSKLRYVILQLLLQIVHFVRKRNLCHKKFPDALLSSIWYINILNECKYNVVFSLKAIHCHCCSHCLNLKHLSHWKLVLSLPGSSEILFDYKLKPSLFFSFSSSTASEAACCSVALVLGTLM